VGTPERTFDRHNLKRSKQLHRVKIENIPVVHSKPSTSPRELLYVPLCNPGNGVYPTQKLVTPDAWDQERSTRELNVLLLANVSGLKGVAHICQSSVYNLSVHYQIHSGKPQLKSSGFSLEFNFEATDQ